MIRRALLIAAVATSASALSAASASAVQVSPNPWLQNHFLNIAHQGGEDEAPSSTLFAFKSAVASRGADMLELDVNLTADGHLVVIHDDTVNRTTEETGLREDGQSEVEDLTLTEVQALDAGYTFRPGGNYDKSEPASAYPYRGIRTGVVPPPPGYAPRDFRIPTLEEVLDAFPTTPINIEIKMAKNQVPGSGCVDNGAPPPYCDDPAGSIPIAQALAGVLNSPDYTYRTDIIVVSFSDLLMDEFASLAPDVHRAPAVVDTTFYVIGGVQPDPDVVAFQVPPSQEGIAVPEKLLGPPPEGQDAHGEGYAVHVWPNGAEPDGEASYDRLIKLGIDGYMSSQPGRLHAFLCAQEIPRPNGADRCPNAAAAKAAKKCKKGKGKRKKGKGKRADATHSAATKTAAASKKKKCGKKRKKGKPKK